MCIPGTQAFGIGMFVAGIQGAISGFLIGGLIGGIISAVQGNSFWEGACKSAIDGLINGFTAGALLFCISSGISATAGRVKAANAAKINELKFANRGSTGRTEANNLYEQLAMKQVQASPLANSEHLSNIMLRDTRRLAGEGWVKMQQVYQFSNGSSATIHYVLNDALSLIDDFKFVFPL